MERMQDIVGMEAYDAWVNGNFSDLDRHDLIAIASYWEKVARIALKELAEVR